MVLYFMSCIQGQRVLLTQRVNKTSHSYWPKVDSYWVTPTDPQSYSFGHYSIDAQLVEACKGKEKPVKDLQTNTGTKDTYTQYWIDFMIREFERIQTANPLMSVREVEQQLEMWLTQNKERIISLFLKLKGMAFKIQSSTLTFNLK
jgi:hypothetical protein